MMPICRGACRGKIAIPAAGLKFVQVKSVALIA